MPTLTTDDSNGLQRSGDFRAAGPACEAQDLKRILTLLADQIADADRRHSDALAAMQARLGQLGASADGLRDQLPTEMAPAMDRIQGGMSALSEQLASSAQQLTFAPQPMFAVQPQAPIAMEQPVFQAPLAPPTPPTMAPPAEPAPALRSALAADALDAFARRAHASRTASHPAIDHFDVVGSDTPRTEQSWDMAAAQALSTHYESPVAHPAANDAEIAQALEAEAAKIQSASTTPPAPVLSFASVFPLPYVPGLSAPVMETPTAVSTAQFAAEVVSFQSKAFEDERRWLEDQFGDIAKRLESSIRELDPTTPLGSLDARFDQLEQKLAEAIRGAAKNTDLAVLKGIENQVEDLAAQFLTMQTHFSRLDNIELELRSIVEQMLVESNAAKPSSHQLSSGDDDTFADAVASRVISEMPRLDDQLKQLSASFSTDKIAAILSKAQPEALDADDIAFRVAEQLINNLPKNQASVADTTPQLEELRGLIENFTAEQRHGDEQTSTMLDTMQQAMIRLLDRMDAIEQIATAERYDEEPAAHRQHAPAAAASVSHAQPAVSEQAAHYPASVQNLRNLQQAYPQQPAPADVPADQPARGLTPLAPPLASRPAPAPARENQAEATGSSSREEFIASARRAARMANETPPNDDADAAERDATISKVRRPTEAAEPAKARTRRPLSKVSMALLCVVAVGASFALVKSTILAPGSAPRPSAAVQKAAPPAKALDKLQELEDADVIIEEERRGPQRRSSLPGQSGAGNERDFATAFEGGPGNAVPASQLQNYGGFTPAMSEFARQNIPSAGAASPSTPAALTRDKPPAAAGKAEPLPLTIGPNSLRNAALKGDPSAEFEIGARFAEGRGVPQDLDQAINWYQKSAAQGFAAAQYRLGSMYERGLGVKIDLPRARVWYQRAAEQGIVKAMHNLAVLSAGRDASSTDYETAAKWFRSAADYGLTDSQFNLAIMYDSGLGMPRDAKLAYRYFSLAARSGDDEAARRRETLRQKLTPQEMTEVDADLAKWRPRSADQAVNDPRMAGEGWKARAR